MLLYALADADQYVDVSSKLSLRRLVQNQVMKLQSSTLLLNSIQLNQLIGHLSEESEMAASSETDDVEEDDG